MGSSIEDSSIELSNGVRLFYQDTGGNGTPLICIHGIWASSKFFCKQLEGLGEDIRVIALDLRGHGRSSMTMSGQTVPNYAKDVKLFIDALGIENYIAVGWSMGCFVWWDFFQQFGAHSMGGLVVSDQAPSDYRSEEYPIGLISHEKLRNWVFRAQTERNALIKELLPTMFANELDPDDILWMHEEMTRAPDVIAALALFDQSTRDYRDTLKDFPVPTLVCSGELSQQPLAGAELIVELVKDGRLEIFEGCGHALHFENSEKFNRLVVEFARSL